MDYDKEIARLKREIKTLKDGCPICTKLNKSNDDLKMPSLSIINDLVKSDSYFGISEKFIILDQIKHYQEHYSKFELRTLKCIMRELGYYPCKNSLFVDGKSYRYWIKKGVNEKDVSVELRYRSLLKEKERDKPMDSPYNVSAPKPNTDSEPKPKPNPKPETIPKPKDIPAPERDTRPAIGNIDYDDPNYQQTDEQFERSRAAAEECVAQHKYNQEMYAKYCLKKSSA